MRTRVHAYLAIAVVGLAAAGCGSSSSTSSKKPASAAESAEAQIKANWASFFSPSTSASEKEALLQNGAQFSAVIKTATSNPLASQVSAKVNEVTITGPTTATVKYTVSLAGKPVLSNATGSAVKSGDTWLVGDVSFCQLLKLEGASAAACAKA
jgi:hypothetical protein